MKKMMLMLVALLFMTMAMAQNANGRQSRKMDAATVTTMMTQKLGLNADQQKKVEALNKKYESVLRPGKGGRTPRKSTEFPRRWSKMLLSLMMSEERYRQSWITPI